MKSKEDELTKTQKKRIALIMLNEREAKKEVIKASQVPAMKAEIARLDSLRLENQISYSKATERATRAEIKLQEAQRLLEVKNKERRRDLENLSKGLTCLQLLQEGVHDDSEDGGPAFRQLEYIRRIFQRIDSDHLSGRF